MSSISLNIIIYIYIYIYIYILTDIRGKMESAIWVQIPNEADYASLYASALWEGMNRSVVSPGMSKKLGRLDPLRLIWPPVLKKVNYEFKPDLVTAKIRLSTRTATTKHYDWTLLNNRDIRDKYVLELRNRFETLQEKEEEKKYPKRRIWEFR